MPVRLQWHDNLGELVATAGGTLDRHAQERLFDRLDWFRMTAKHGLARRPLVVSAHDADGAVYLFLERSGRRRATPLASWYTFAFRPVIVGAGLALLPALFREARHRIDRLTLTPVPDDDLAPIRDALVAAGWIALVDRASTSRTAKVDCRSFAEWWDTRPTRLRNTVARRKRSHTLMIDIDDRFSAEAWAAYENVYRASWKPAEGSMTFLRDLAEREGAAGTLRLGIGRDQSGDAVAAQLWLVEGGRATIHKLAHREDAHAGSPGSILSAAMFAHAIDRDRATILDFGLGDEPYKADWMDEAAPVWRIDAYRPATAIGAAGIARETLRRLVERLRGR